MLCACMCLQLAHSSGAVSNRIYRVCLCKKAKIVRRVTWPRPSVDLICLFSDRTPFLIFTLWSLYTLTFSVCSLSACLLHAWSVSECVGSWWWCWSHMTFATYIALFLSFIFTLLPVTILPLLVCLVFFSFTNSLDTRTSFYHLYTCCCFHFYLMVLVF